MDQGNRFSPTWWAAWTAALYRPGRRDDELVDGLDGMTPWWDHVNTSESWSWNLDKRPDWPMLLYSQQSRDPVPTDLCYIKGRCVGACNEIVRVFRGENP